MSWLARIFIVFTGLCLAVGVGLYQHTSDWGDEPHSLGAPVELQFPKGTSLTQLASQLENKKIISSSALFRFWVRGFADYRQFQAGRYRFSDSLSPRQVASAFIRGEVFRPALLTVTIPEGFTLEKIIKRFGSHGVSEAELRRLAVSEQFLTDHGIQAKSLEGYLYPATYVFYEMPDAERVLVAMLEKMNHMFTPEIRQALRAKGLSVHESLTFASLIELETLHEDERPRVAEVIWNRLGDGTPLGIDAAVIYGIEDYRGDITFKHLRDRKNPYNTRIFKGLPPGPIGAPSIESIKSILTPTDEGWRFYVRLAGEERRHKFTRTLREHNHYVRLFLKATKR